MTSVLDPVAGAADRAGAQDRQEVPSEILGKAGTF